MVRFSKFTLNINIYDEFVGFLSKLVWRETLFVSGYIPDFGRKLDTEIEQKTIT